MDTIINWILHFLSNSPKELAIFIIATLPVGELRFSIPIGIYLLGKDEFARIFILSILGNAVPIIPLLVLLTPVSEKLSHFRLWRKFFEWLTEKTRKKGDLIQKYEALGLAIFVAVPCPGTGIWSGCLAASLFKIKFRYAFPAILLGMIGAGVITTILSFMGLVVWQNLR